MKNCSGRSVAILKVDVEGAEQAVLEGAANALKEGRLRHIIFEDHHGSDSAVMTRLLGYGYAIYFDRVDADGAGAGRSRQRSPAHARYEAPSYLATLDSPGAEGARGACVEARE